MLPRASIVVRAGDGSQEEPAVTFGPESRVEAALGAGGPLDRHDTEEGFWTLAEPVGNEVDDAATSAPSQDT